MKKRIVFGINGLTVGGAEYQLTRLLRHLNTESYDFHVITLQQFPDEEELYGLLSSEVTIHKCNVKNAVHIGGWLQVYRILKKIKPHIVVSSFFLSNTIFRILRPFFGYCVISREHNTYLNKPKFHQIIDRVLAAQSKTIIAVSEDVADFTVKQEGIPRKKFTVIHNGISIDAVSRAIAAEPSKENIRKRLGVGLEEVMLVSVGRLAPQKDHELMLEGFAIFSREHPNAVLCIVGSGSQKNILHKKVVELGIKKKVFFFGFQSNVWQFYKAGDILISTSETEGFSNVYLEALAAGLPLVVTKTAGTKEIIREGETGVFVERNPESVAEGVAKVASMDFGYLAGKAKEEVARFSIEKTAAAYEKVFQNCR